MSRDGAYQNTGKESGPREHSVPEFREVRFEKEGAASRVVPTWGLRREMRKGYWVWQLGNL